MICWYTEEKWKIIINTRENRGLMGNFREKIRQMEPAGEPEVIETSIQKVSKIE